MQKKMNLFILVCLVVFVAVSCKNDDDKVERTPEMEVEELNSALSSLTSMGYDIDTTDLGVYYIIHKEGTGLFPNTGDTLFLNYTGYLLDGTIFDASEYYYADSIWQFVYKEIDLIPGFDDALAIMNKGTEMDIIIPSELAYGSVGNGIIPPYATIMFSAKLVDIKPPSE